MEKANMGPRYKQIKEDIVDDILSAVYTPGDVLPGQDEMARKYNVSRLTVRKAIDSLVEKGILRTEKGKGTFVQEVAANIYGYRRLSGFSSNLISNKAKTHSRVLGIRELPADKRLSVHLAIPVSSAVICIERLRYVNEVCTSYHKSYLAKERVRGIDFVAEDLGSNSLYTVLRERAGITLCYVDEHFRAIRATEEIASYFQIEEGDPVLYVMRVTLDGEGVPIEYCQNYDSSDVNGAWIKSVSI